MKSPRLKFSILALMLLTAVIAVGVMLYQRHVAWNKAETEFNLIIDSTAAVDDRTQQAAKLVACFPQLVKRPGAMTFATNTGNDDLCRQFLEAGADPNDPDSGADHAPIFRPLIDDNADMVALLIDHGAEMKVRSKWFDSKRTLLHLAAAWESPNVCRVLIERGIDVNSIDSSGTTPLHDAAETANAELIKVLLEQGVKSSKDDQGRTPYDIAQTKYRKFVGLQEKLREFSEVVSKLKELDAVSPSQSNRTE